MRNLSRPGVRIINCPPQHKEMQVTQWGELMQGINLWIVALVKNQSSDERLERLLAESTHWLKGEVRRRRASRRREDLRRLLESSFELLV